MAFLWQRLHISFSRDFVGGKEVTGELQEPKTRLPNQIKINIAEYW